MNESPASFSDLGPAAPPPGPIALRLPSTPPRVAYALLVITILVYVLQLLSNALLGFDLPVDWGVKSNELIRAGQIWRLITPVLLHGSLLHIGFNMYALFALGPGLERRFGHIRFILLYLLAGFAGNVFSFLITPENSLGASSSIFGLIAAEGIFLYQNRKLFGDESKQAMGNVISIILVNLVIGFSSGGLIDNWGHIGGLLGGLVFTWFGGPLWRVEGIYPLLRLVDKRAGRDVVLGVAAVLFIFGALAMVGMFWPLVP